MERVHLDFLGPLPKTDKGNEYCLVMVDQFTNWVECIPVPSQTAEITAVTAVNEFFGRFGYPFEIFTNQGRNFQSQLCSSICELLHIHKTQSTSYRPSGNVKVERFNKTIMAAVRCFIDKKQGLWDKYLAQINGAIRASVNRSTGFTPNRLMLGREVNLPADLVFPFPQQPNTNTLPEYVSELEQTLKQTHKMAREVLKTTQKIMKKNYDLRVSAKKYKLGDPIYLLYTAAIKGKCKKLSPVWQGLCLVTKVLSAYLYRVKFRKLALIVNHDRMKLCKDRKLLAWLIKAKQQLGYSEIKDLKSKITNIKPVYCTCRKPYNGQFMICCDDCHEWYHWTCEGISAEDELRIDVYTCPECSALLA